MSQDSRVRRGWEPIRSKTRPDALLRLPRTSRKDTWDVLGEFMQAIPATSGERTYNACHNSTYRLKWVPTGVLLGLAGQGWNLGEHAADARFQRVRALEHIGAQRNDLVEVKRVLCIKQRVCPRRNANFQPRDRESVRLAKAKRAL